MIESTIERFWLNGRLTEWLKSVLPLIDEGNETEETRYDRLVAAIRVSFRWRDYVHGGKKKVMTVSADEFLRRFLLHVLPKGLVRIRHFGLFANRRRSAEFQRCRELLGTAPEADCPEATNHLRCPACSAAMLVVERITGAQIYFRTDRSFATQQRCNVDSS
jgi:hypothetical protein